MRKLCLLFALLALLAGCDLTGSPSGATSTTGDTAVATDTPAASTTDVPTTVPGVTATNTPTGFQTPTAKNCSADFPRSGGFGYFGDMIISEPTYGRSSFLGLRLPDNMPHGLGKPFQLAGPSSIMPFIYGVNQDPAPVVLASPTSPVGVLGNADSGFAFTICNSSTTKTHTLNALGIQIASFVPATSTNINVEMGCDSAASNHTGAFGHCGGIFTISTNAFMVNWPTGAGVGTMGAVTQNSSASGMSLLPITMKPGQTYTASVGTQFPGKSGTYTFTFGMQVDNMPVATVGYASFPLFLGVNFGLWTGAACLADPVWKAIVLASTHYFVCPVMDA